MLIKQIKQDQVTARKNKDAIAANLLTTLIGEAEMVGKNNGNRSPSDIEVTAVVKKFVKGIDEILSLTFDNSEKSAAFLKEKEILTAYLPKQLTQEQLETAISEFLTEAPGNVGFVMKELAKKYNGAFDGKAASELIRKAIAQ